MDNEQLRQLLRQPEGPKLEFKRELYKIDHPEHMVRKRHWGEFIKDVLALANGNVNVAGQTAYLIIGAGDELKADGTRDLYDVGDVKLTRQRILQKVNKACSPPLPDIHCDIVTLEGDRIFAVSIPPSPHLHETTCRLETSGGTAYSESTVFIRRADGVFPASVPERHAIQKDKQTGVLERKPLQPVPTMEAERRAIQVDKQSEVVHRHPVTELVALGESATLEFKSTLQWDVKRDQVNKELRFSVLKTIAAFLNTEGGTLVIGVEDDGHILGLAQDLSMTQNSTDRFEQRLMNLVADRIGAEFAPFIKVRFEEIDGQMVCVVDVGGAPKPAFMRGSDRKHKEFYVRMGCTSRPLDIKNTADYVRMKWKLSLDSTAEAEAATPSEQTEYPYDVFISYSHADQEWVRNELLPRLEGAGLKVIIDYRDFDPGALLLTEMKRAVVESRKMVMVLTPAYLNSEWTGFERSLAQSLDPEARRRRLLPIVLQRCEIPLELRNLVYVDLSPPQPCEAQFQRLLKALTTDVPTDPVIDVPDSIDIPAGLFWMGSLLEDTEARGNEKPRRDLDLEGYRIGRYPVTNAQYAHFVRDTGHRVPEHWDEGRVPAGLEGHPVVNVSHDDAEAYCRWLSQVTGQHWRLPTEEEWEKAARGRLPETRRYPWGDEWQSGLCNTQELGRNETTSVHEFEERNLSPFGVVDMAGNAWEWTASCYERYPGSPHESPKYGQLYRVVRGGSWRSRRQAARISCRGRYKPDERRPHLGFRIAAG